MKTFFGTVGVTFPDKYLAQELHDRPAFDLAEQRKIFENSSTGNSEIGKWWNEVGKFMISVGVINTIPDPKNLVTDKYLQMIQRDRKLREFANNASD